MGPIRLGSLLAALLSLVAAQTPNGFIPEVDTSLTIVYDGSSIPAGQQLPQSGISAEPEINIDSSLLTTPPNATTFVANATTGLLIMMDLDVPRNGTRTTLLHWLSPNIDLSTTPASFSSSQGAPYLPPSPPAGDSPHRYVFLLFAQPDGFTIPSTFDNINPPSSSAARVGFDLTSFAAQTSLSLPLAANYITVQNTSASASSSSFPPSGTGFSAGSSGGLNGTIVMSSLAPSAAPPAATGSAGANTGNGATAKGNGAEKTVPGALGLLIGLAALVM
ncbi:PEBP-like protein [Microthyrium microscopicum]|uniref:PEBP-like protein n=1 Tax=Microthyrium microscopicum TaxID=703497 RepID=A0A6A6U8Y7_9PEZI|nr:PEBP-like protein [Microthyrium microscopicum]